MAVVVFCPPCVGAVAVTCTAPEVEVGAVRFEADRWVDEAGLGRIAGFHFPLRWNAARAASVRAALMQTRVFDAVDTRLVAEDGECVAIVALDHRPIVRRVTFYGIGAPRTAVLTAMWRWLTFSKDRAPLPGEREVFRLLPLRVGSFFEAEALDRGTQRILSRYHAAGYGLVSVSTRYAERQGGIEIDIFVDPGVPLLVTEVEVVADDPAARLVAERVMQAALGGPKGARQERETRRTIILDLRREGFFDAKVAVAWEPRDEAGGILRATVEAGSRTTIEVVGNEAISTDDLIGAERLYERVIVTDNTWRQLASAMVDLYQSRGYYAASVRLESPSEGDLVYRVDEGGRFAAGEAHFVGNQALSDETLRSVVSTGASSWLSAMWPPRVTDSVLGDDLARIRDRYARAGFERADVTRTVDLDPRRELASVTFSVVEGPRTLVGSVSRSGGGDFSAEVRGPAVGDPLDVRGLEEERDRLISSLQGRGYLGAEVEVDVERELVGREVRAELDWKVAPGPLHRVGAVVVQENSETQYVVVERDLPFGLGDPIKPDVLLDAQQDVYAAGVFRNVSISPLPDGVAQKRDRGIEASGEVERTVAVKVAASAPGRFSYGAGYDTVQGLTGFTELRYSNLNRRAQSLRVRAEVGVNPSQSVAPTQYRVTAGLVEPRLFDGGWSWHVNALSERDTKTVNRYDITRSSVATGVSREILEGLRFGSDLQIEFARIFDVEPVPFRSRDERDSWTTSISPFLVYDGRDSAFDPRDGFFESLRIRYAVPGVSEIDVIEVDAQHTHLIPLWRDWGFVYSLRVGWVRSLDGNSIVPIRQRYFLGGGASVRGFAVNGLGPYDGNGADVGGDLAVVAKTELRIPLFWGLGLVAFVDGGGNYLIRCSQECRAGDPGDPDTRIRDAAATLDNFRGSAGLGLRYVTPIGPISVDYGVKLDRRTRQLADGSTSEESFGEFSVSVGARF